jgi:hypothetical protein
MATSQEEKAAIRELMSMYCFYSDSGNADALVALFTAPCMWDGGKWGRYETPAALHEFVVSATTGGEAKFRHLNVNEIIRVTGDNASACSYIMVLNGAAQPPAPFFVGYYDDEFVKIDGHWRFKSRVMREK